MYPKVQDKDIEEAWILLLNQKLDLIEAKCISHGGITGTAIDIRIILKEALLRNALLLLLCHNHPSGNPRPSREDDNITNSLKKAADTMHILFCRSRYSCPTTLLFVPRRRKNIIKVGSKRQTNVEF